MKSPRWYGRDGSARWEGDVRHARKEKALPSVTSVIDMWPKGWLEPYIKRQMWEATVTTPRTSAMGDEEFWQACLKWADEHRDRAADRGTRIHHCIHISGRQPEPDIAPFFDAFEKWNANEGGAVLWQEKTLVNVAGGYAGQADRLVETMDGLYLDDFKTSAVKDKSKPPFYDNYPIQLAAYHKALAQPGVQCRSIVINTLEAEAPYVRVWSESELFEGWERFKLCYEMFVSLKHYDPRKV